MKMAAAVVCVTEMAVIDLWLWLNVEPETLFKTADPLKPEFKRLPQTCCSDSGKRFIAL